MAPLRVTVAGFEVVAVGFLRFSLCYQAWPARLDSLAARSGFKNGLRSGATCWDIARGLRPSGDGSNKIALAVLQTIASFYVFGFTKRRFCGLVAVVELSG